MQVSPRISRKPFSFPVTWVLGFFEIRRDYARFSATEMHKANSIIMRAPIAEIFETAANLELWPKILPHYRYIHYLERSPNRNLVVMAARHAGMPISWTSEQIIDRDKMEVRFHHLKAFTKGMNVVWTFHPTADGVKVEIVHDLNFRIPSLGFLAEPIIGNGFIHPVATRTLRCMKKHLESAGPNGENTAIVHGTP
jgi:ribosome-associated toxin RatA of RatAB toxin-antitoxin module